MACAGCLRTFALKQDLLAHNSAPCHEDEKGFLQFPGDFAVDPADSDFYQALVIRNAAEIQAVFDAEEAAAAATRRAEIEAGVAAAAAARQAELEMLVPRAENDEDIDGFLDDDD